MLTDGSVNFCFFAALALCSLPRQACNPWGVALDFLMKDREYIEFGALLIP